MLQTLRLDGRDLDSRYFGYDEMGKLRIRGKSTFEGGDDGRGLVKCVHDLHGGRLYAGLRDTSIGGATWWKYETERMMM